MVSKTKDERVACMEEMENTYALLVGKPEI
jgi:hypothetical protein